MGIDKRNARNSLASYIYTIFMRIKYIGIYLTLNVGQYTNIILPYKIIFIISLTLFLVDMFESEINHSHNGNNGGKFILHLMFILTFLVFIYDSNFFNF